MNVINVVLDWVERQVLMWVAFLLTGRKPYSYQFFIPIGWVGQASHSSLFLLAEVRQASQSSLFLLAVMGKARNFSNILILLFFIPIGWVGLASHISLFLLAEVVNSLPF